AGAGTFTAQLTLTDAAGHTATGSATITVSPTLSATAGVSPTSGQAPLSVGLTGTPAGGKAPYSFSWNFGDGSATSTAQNPTHLYASAGTFTARLTVTDANGSSVTVTSAAITASLAPLTAAAGATPVGGDAPLPVSFNASGAGGTAPLSYGWTFGDGSSGTGASPSHT